MSKIFAILYYSGWLPDLGAFFRPACLQSIKRSDKLAALIPVGQDPGIHNNSSYIELPWLLQ
jgi:hypothetical protein